VAEFEAGDFLGYPYFVLYVTRREDQFEEVYTLDGTRYGRLLLIFVESSRELETFKAYAQETLKPGYSIETAMIVAYNLDQVQVALEREEVLPSGTLVVAVEGTPFFDEVIDQLRAETIWAD
jgi:hypothetical protein